MTKERTGRYKCLVDARLASQDKAHRAATKAPDAVNRPAHYTDGKIEVIDFIEDKGLNFHRGNAIKYIARAGKKNPAKEVEDLEKACWYINREIERLKGLKAQADSWGDMECANCKHSELKASEHPCNICEDRSKWEPREHQEPAGYGCETCKHAEQPSKCEPCLACSDWSKWEARPK